MPIRLMVSVGGVLAVNQLSIGNLIQSGPYRDRTEGPID
jgi:hypothetical protein